jgi:ParB-like chromosome segregation protein Spo0J
LGDIPGLSITIDPVRGPEELIVVDQNNNLVAGERRLEACKHKGMKHVPVRRIFVDAETTSLLEIVEDWFRKDFTPLEAL